MIVLPDTRECRALLALPWHVWPTPALRRWAERQPIVAVARRLDAVRPPLRMAQGAEA